MNGKVCVVTGATSGIGKAAAIALARQGAQVLLVGRDQGRAEETAAEIGSVSTAPPKVEIADFASMEEVRALAASEPARVVAVTSDAHSAAILDLDDPNLEHGWDSWRSYANSKLANIQFTRELARRLHGTGLTANCVHPGVVRTGFGREGTPLLRLGVTLARPFLLSPERGADTIVYLSSSPDVAAESGGYYVKRQRREPSAAARDDAEARKLWEISEKMTGLAPARSGPADAPA